MTPGDLSDLLKRLQNMEAFLRQLQQSGALRWMPPTADVIESRVFFNAGQARDGSNWRWEYDLKEFDWPASDADKYVLPTAKSTSPVRKGYNAYELGNTTDANAINGVVDSGANFDEVLPVKCPLLLCHLVRSTSAGKDPRWMFAMPNDVKCSEVVGTPGGISVSESFAFG